mgnify:CR=1 FL=1
MGHLFYTNKRRSKHLKQENSMSSHWNKQENTAITIIYKV